MKKFTIFTIILTIVVVVVLAELMAKDYLPGFSTGKEVALDQGEDGMKLTLPASLDTKKSMATNVLGSDGTDLTNRLGADVAVVPRSSAVESPVSLPDTTPNPEFLDPNSFIDPADVANPVATSVPKDSTTQTPLPTGQAGTQAADTSGVKDFEDENVNIKVPVNVYLRDEQIKSAGFTGGYLESEPFDGLLFKTIDISDLKDTEVTKTLIRTQEEILAKVYVFKIGIGSSVDEVYKSLRLKASQGLNIKLNETNEFGAASFFMNDPVRSDTAFLVVRISGLVYSYSYPKTYHSQIKNLIQLITWELG